MEYTTANPLEMSILGFLKNFMRGTTAFSYQLPNFGYDYFFLETAFKFLREKKYIQIEMIEENLFLPSAFKLKITDSGIKFYDEEQAILTRQHEEIAKLQASIPQDTQQPNFVFSQPPSL